MKINRREFLLTSALAVVADTGKAHQTRPCCRLALLSDLHLDGSDPTAHQNLQVGKIVTDVIKLSPRPDRIVIFGDVACHDGCAQDYQLAAEILRPFADAGIPVEFMMGNHDRRETLCEVFPSCRRSEVSGRLVSVVDCGVVQLVLLDSHDDGKVDGAIDSRQMHWLETFLDKTDKPVFICAHHDGRQMKRFAAAALTRSSKVVGYLHGHRHAWLPDALHGWNGPAGARFVRSVGLPSTGFWGDIGFAVLDCFVDEAVMTLHESDCFFPTPATRTPTMHRMREENDGARIVFQFADVVRPVTEKGESVVSAVRMTGPLRVVFTGTGGADWAAGPKMSGENRAFSSVLLDDRVLIDWHGSARPNLPVGARPEAIVHTHSHRDHFSPADTIALGSVKRVYVERGWSDNARVMLKKAAAVAKVAPPQVIAVDLFSPFIEGGLEFCALPANHQTSIASEQCVIYLVRKSGEKGGAGVNLLYATDTGGLMKAAVDKIDGCLTAIIMNAMIGPGRRDNRRIFSHCTVEQVAETISALRAIGKYDPPIGLPVWTTHLSRELNAPQQELKDTYPTGLVPAYDGFCIVLNSAGNQKSTREEN